MFDDQRITEMLKISIDCIFNILTIILINVPSIFFNFEVNIIQRQLLTIQRNRTLDIDIHNIIQILLYKFTISDITLVAYERNLLSVHLLRRSIEQRLHTDATP